MLSDRCLSCPVCNVGVNCSQMIGWIKMKLGMEVGVCPDHIVLDENPATLPQRVQPSPNFRPMSVVAKRLDGTRCHLVWW